VKAVATEESFQLVQIKQFTSACARIWFHVHEVYYCSRKIL